MPPRKAKTRTAPLLKHAERYGVDGVMDAGIDLKLSFGELVELQTELWRIENEQLAAARRFFTPKKRKLTAEEVVRRLLGLPEDAPEAA